MATMLVAFVVLLLVVAAMAVGVMFGRPPIKGSCGGVGAALGEKDYVCELCGDDETKCEEIKSGAAAATTASLAYEVIGGKK
jgi:hypothetical protein